MSALLFLLIATDSTGVEAPVDTGKWSSFERSRAYAACAGGMCLAISGLMILPVDSSADTSAEPPITDADAFWIMGGAMCLSGAVLYHLQGCPFNPLSDKSFVNPAIPGKPSLAGFSV